MTLPRKVALALAGAGVVWLGFSLFHSRALPTHPLDAVPADAFVAIEIDVGALRRSGALTALFGDKDEQSLTKVCGFDPVDRMEDLVFTVPEEAPGEPGRGKGDFGVAVQADVSQNDLLRCASELVKAHGGDPTADTASYGSYEIITPKQTSAESTKPPRSVGYHRGGPILVGPRAWLERMVDAVDAVAEGRGSPGEHRSLRTKVAEGISPAPTLLVTASVVLARSVREKLRAEMAAEVGPGNDSGTAMMLGVLGMSSGVLGLFERGDEIRAVAQLHCEEELQCVEVQKLIAKVRGEWARMPELRGFGLGPVVDHLEVDHHGTWLEVRAGAATADVVRWAKLFIDSKPIASTPTVATAEAPGSAAPDVPGQPFTVQVPTPSPSASGRVIRGLTLTVPPSRLGSPTPPSAGSTRPPP